MIKSKLIIIICLLFSIAGVQAQEYFSKEVKGQVSSADGDVEATHVLNISTDKATITDVDGFFKIAASLYDTIVFSSVQYAKKEIIVTGEILESKTLFITLEEAVNELEEIVVRPYNLSGDLSRDMYSRPLVTAGSLGLPNAYVKKMAKSERAFHAATAGGSIISPTAFLNMLSGRKKMLRERIRKEKAYARTERVRDFYSERAFKDDMNIGSDRIDDFMYFCEIDTRFQGVVDTHDKIKIWQFMINKSRIYRKNNNIPEPKFKPVTEADFRKQ
ncbi:carboxypeptidase-like regulatory domain-containing protein [Cellulophaga baltica]|uniref:carboxypeptidase-like regulatory domain-containing protein n=1 Tax=Cellulophaga TaxID=104264 RepID=UPI001C06821A|nr:MULTISPECIES: carboxypeptidase-like regulatory domain-containing protein [Cellulophaga]MBU2995010.1 carboxypeptidase-like regulatory domain-containing protein [Cellulophaga baltica]MDO6766405.1 carboxypeptidase-like regulatory domain-containing protein [Cellulophaga sp. 1_MG-2023]